MALPGGLVVGQSVQYLPNVFDAVAWNDGQQVPVAALVTKIDSANNRIDLVVFPSGKGPLFRYDVEYFTDTADDENGFKLSSDALTCTTENGSMTASDTTYSHFVIDFTPPSGSHGYLIFYRVNGSGTWLTPNQPGNATATYEYNQIIFNGLSDTVTYDFLLQNVCNNGVASSGVSITETATAPL